jgi:WD40 repeat protein
MYSCSADLTIRKWDLEAGQTIQIMKGINFQPTLLFIAGNYLYSQSTLEINVWKISDGRIFNSIQGLLFSANS